MISRINVPMSYLFTYIILVQKISYPKLLEERKLWRGGPGGENCLFCLWPFAEDNFLLFFILFCFVSNLQSYDYTVIPGRELYKAIVLWDAQGHYPVQKKENISYLTERNHPSLYKSIKLKSITQERGEAQTWQTPVSDSDLLSYSVNDHYPKQWVVLHYRVVPKKHSVKVNRL